MGDQEEKGLSVLPKVTENIQKFAWNYEYFKAELQQHIQQYKGLVVNEENLPDMEKTKRDIASLRVRLSKFKTQIKAELDKPYKAFDGQMKELFSLVEDAEKPLSDQLEKYENQRRASKEYELLQYIADKAAEMGLEEKYSSQIVIDHKWLNRTQKWSDTENDILQRLAWHLDIQAQERQADLFREQKAEMAKLLCQSLSAGLATPLTYEEVANRIEQMQDILQVKSFIEQEVAKRKEREERAAQQAIERAEQERIAAEQKAERERIAEEKRVEQMHRLAEQAKQQNISVVAKSEPARVTPLLNAQFIVYGITESDIENIKQFFNMQGFEFKHAVKPANQAS